MNTDNEQVIASAVWVGLKLLLDGYKPSYTVTTNNNTYKKDELTALQRRQRSTLDVCWENTVTNRVSKHSWL